jgi:hypothetical protein
MALPSPPAMPPDFCGCCTPEAPLSPMFVFNRPGLSRISYRVGDYATFRETLLESIAREPRLAGLTTRDSADYSITLFELFAAMGDVLTFYNERIANELFLRPANERDSIRRLVSLIGYRPRPGLAATTLLSFMLDAGAVTPIRAGLKVMSIPGPNERAQTYETTEELVAEARLNAVPLFMPPTAINPLGPGRTEAPLLARPERLSRGDRLLLFNADRVDVREVSRIEARSDGERLHFNPPLDGGFSVDSGFAMKMLRSLNLFAHDSPDSVNYYDPTAPTVQDRWKTKSPDQFIAANSNSYPLDRKLSDLKPGALLLVDLGSGTPRYQLVSVVATEDQSASWGPDRRETVTHVQLRETIRGRPLIIPVPGNTPRIFARSGTGMVMDLGPFAPGTPLSAQRTTAQPAAVSSGGGRIDLLVRDESRAIRHASWTPSGWSGWTSLGGIATSRPVVVSDAPGSVWLFVRGTDCALWTRHSQAGVWSNWASLGGILTSAPAAISQGPGKIDVFVRGEDLALWRLERTAAGWGDWATLGGSLGSEPAATSLQPGAIDVAIVDGDGNLMHRRLRDARWSKWAKLGAAFAAEAPELICTAPNRIELIVRGRDGVLAQLEWTGDTWSAAAKLDGAASSQASAVVYGPAPTLILLARLPTGVLGIRGRIGSTWTAWVAVGGSLGYIADRRRTRIFEVDAAELSLRDYDYPQPNSGARLAVRLDILSELAKGRTILLDDGKRRQVATVTGTTVATCPVDEPHLFIDFDPPIAGSIDAITMNGNVVAASHGETPNPAEEPLGHGDAARAFQSFKLRRSPLTYLPSANDIAGEPAIQIRVNGELWKEAPSFYGRGSTELIYTLRQNDDGETTVMFGDGRTGARIPTGAMNVVARYRTGLGLAGRVKADQLSIALERPVGLRSVSNPLPADGGADPEPLANMRAAAPTTVRTFRRAISLDDFAWVATTSGLVARAVVTWVWSGLEKAIHLTVAAQDGAPLSAASLKMLHEALGRARDPNHPLMLGNICRVPVTLAAKLIRSPDYTADDVLAAATAAIADFFAFENMGFARAVHLSDMFAVLQGAEGVVGVDIDCFQLRGYDGLSAAQLALRSATADPVQPHIRIHLARPLPDNPALIDPFAMACFDGAIPPQVLPAEQAYLADPADVSLTVVKAH